MENNTYNGWTNYETWAWKLWIDNDQGSQEHWIEQAKACADSETPVFDLADKLAEDADEMVEASEMPFGPLRDILTAGLGNINWHEIAKSFIEAANNVTA